jgi:hypothetical protein
MDALLLHVSQPKRPNPRYEIPDALLGEAAHYMYDISLSPRTRPQVGSKIFLWGTKQSGKHGLFASGTCEIPDDQTVPQQMEHDAFLLLRHDRIPDQPISPEHLEHRYPELYSLLKTIEASTLLEFFRLDERQTELLDQALSD